MATVAHLCSRQVRTTPTGADRPVNDEGINLRRDLWVPCLLLVVLLIEVAAGLAMTGWLASTGVVAREDGGLR